MQICILKLHTLWMLSNIPLILLFTYCFWGYWFLKYKQIFNYLFTFIVATRTLHKKIQFKVDINFDSSASKIVFIADLHPEHKPAQWWSINTYSPMGTQTWKVCLFHKYILQILCSSCYPPNQTELFRSVVCKYNQCSQLSYRFLWRFCLQGWSQQIYVS